MSFPQFERLVETIAALRDPKSGCPWDLKQTHKSLLRYLIEESYEYHHAVEEEDLDAMEEEMGDVLLQVILHSQLAKEAGHFDIESVSKVITDKMIRRHPHVFDNKEMVEYSTEQIKDNWQKIKHEEKGSPKKKHRINKSYLSFPALFCSEKIGHKTNKIRFDWDNAHQVIDKVQEEWDELKFELKEDHQTNTVKIKEELGDFLFTIAQLSRHLGIEPEDALREANKKFIRRFNTVEDLIAEDNKELESMNQMEMDVYWTKCKIMEKSK